MAWRQFTADAAKRIVQVTAEVERMALGKTPKFPHGRAVPSAPWYFGKLKSELTVGGSAEMDVYYWSGSAWVDHGWDLTVYAPPLLTSGSIASGKWVRIELNVQAGRWYVVNAEC